MRARASPNPASSGFFRRWIIELPRLSHPSAPPSVILRVTPGPRSSSSAFRSRLRVAPAPRSSGFASGESPGRPESSLPRRLRPVVLRVSSNPHPPSVPAMSLRVTPDRASSGGPGDVALGYPSTCIFRRLRGGISGLPRIFVLPARPATDFRVAPNLASSGSCRISVCGCPRILELRLGR